MKVLIACEESQRVCIAFRERGHEAYSCDIQDCSGGHPEWHIKGDALDAIRGGTITTCDGVRHDVGKWDLLIAHPPCTYLAVSGNRWFDEDRYGEKARQRKLLKSTARIINSHRPRKENHMIHWLWALAAFIFGGSLGTVIMAIIIGGSRGDE